MERSTGASAAVPFRIDLAGPGDGDDGAGSRTGGAQGRTLTSSTMDSV